jgi:hypothetical protein
MGANIPEWTKAHLGQSMTPDQFLSNPQAQDAVFKGQFGQYANKYGPEGAAKAWFAGEGGMNNPNAKDQLGTSVADYGQKFTAALNPQAAIAQAMAPQGPSPVGAAPTPPGGAPVPGAGPSSIGIPDSQKAVIARLLSATPGSPAQQLGMTMMANASKPHDFGFQTLPDGTILRTDPRSGTVQPIYQAPVKPQFSVIGKDRYGNDVHGFVNPSTQKVTPAQFDPTQTAQGSAPGPVDPNITGDAFLSTLPKPQGDQIKGIVEGRISPPGAFALKTPYWQKMLTDVAQYEPGFDLTKWGQRSATAKDFASGKSAQNITAFNTAISHLDTLDKAADALGNTSFPMANTIKNAFGNATGSPQVKQFEIAKTAVADELTRAFRGTGGNVHDLVQWENAINSAGSPAQLKAAVKQAVELLRGRIDSLGDTYNRGMNTKTEPIKLLSPKAQDALSRLSGEGTAETKPQAPAEAPDRSAIEAEMKRRGLL